MRLLIDRLRVSFVLRAIQVFSVLSLISVAKIKVWTASNV